MGDGRAALHGWSGRRTADLVALVPPDDGPLNPAEVPVDGLPLPPLPPSQSNLPPPDDDVAPEPVVVSVRPASGWKRGVQTSEFGLSAVVVVVNTAAAVGLLLAHRLTAGAAGAILAGGNGAVASTYALSRAIVKVCAPRPVPRAR